MDDMTAPVADAVEMETWEIATGGRVWLQVTRQNHLGVPTIQDISVGPNRPGQKLHLTRADRLMNQEKCVSPEVDPFRNGLLVRTDAPQAEDPQTASKDSMTAQQLLDIFAKQGDAFRSAVEPMGEIPLRRLREMAEAVDATVSQVKVLDELIEDRYVTKASQPDAVFSLAGDRHAPGSDGARGSR